MGWILCCAECGNTERFISFETVRRKVVVDGTGDFVAWADDEIPCGPISDPVECDRCGADSDSFFEIREDWRDNEKTPTENLRESGMSNEQIDNVLQAHALTGKGASHEQ